MAKPWLKRVPNTTPNNMLEVLFFVEKDKTKICVLSPNSERNIRIKETIKGYRHCIE